ncbi:endonuclease/exonuclease/phosphatase family protein [Luteolibacter sp. SL250]|uniref:endonuclease/exonuclease/phosphatase family protein n=1 Tax=Luteolibacter sp. SL250 TaxID=2995170 RepID=UPI002270691E|nr:endonuclease/exonuclease/phosphatase family protein [Luteolibacter sp. SL250]WAC20026.1 endonuclease/exonuclease/phosphatase family protein [Luteolibacter sp. SL250]
MALILCGSCRRREAAQVPKAVPVREDGKIEILAATFNIRNENARDPGERAWLRRVANAVRLIRRIQPDVMGMQELTHGQAADLRASLPDYEFFGVGRENGRTQGEYAGIFYRQDRFSRDRAEGGTYWLSGTPEKPGSATWGNTLPRIATWTRLVDLATGRGVYVVNTHFDHQHQGSREQAAVFIASRIDGRRHPEEPVILLGDFNAVETNPAIYYLRGVSANLAGSRKQWKGGMTDTFRMLHPSGTSPKTLHLWGRKDAGWKVDHIFVSKGAQVTEAGAVLEPPPYSSDHFPVIARVVFP